ncbi:hypothetical protein M2283_005538, partial [Streptomyces pseudovenezuelae]|nr:hypothetical protein [Streptomyces pseudovenezuelae]
YGSTVSIANPLDVGSFLSNFAALAPVPVG